MAPRDHQPIRYRPLPADLRSGPSWRSLKYFGAGAIIASVTIGSGETLFASQAGALFSYAILWCFVGVVIMKGIQVYSAARYLILTGVHPMTHWGQLPGPRNWVPLVIGVMSLACFPFWLAGLPLMIGQTLNWIFGIDVGMLGTTAGEFRQTLAALPADDPAGEALAASGARLQTVTRLWATGFVVIAVLLTWLQTYSLLEKGQLLIVGALLACMLVACVAAGPDWPAAAAGLVPSVPEYPDWVRAAYPGVAAMPEWVKVGVFLGAVGGGTYDYIGYVGCFREKEWGAIGCRGDDPPTDTVGRDTVGRDTVGRDTVGRDTVEIDGSPENLHTGRRWLWPVRIDVGVGFAAVLLFTACFVILGAVVLHDERQVPNQFELLSQQAGFLTRLHPALLTLYQAGIFMAFFGTIYGAYEIYIRTAYECLAPLSERIRTMPLRTFRLRTLAYCATGGLLLIWFGGDDASAIVAPAAILGGVFTCGLWCFAMLWLDRRFLPEPLQMGRTLRLANWVSGCLLTGMGIQAILAYLA